MRERRRLRGLWVVALLAFGLPGVLAAPAASAPAGTPHYPDLVTLTPSSLQIAFDGTGHKLLRFSNTVANLGDGRLEVRPQNNASTGQTVAFQRIYTHDAGGAWSLHSEVQIGTFVFHPEHAHFHLEGFSRYELLNEAGAVVSSSEKISFCLLDSLQVNGSLPHAMPRTYLSCSQGAVQGIAVGWADLYSFSLPGQWVEVTGLPNGIYTLRSTTDPFNRITESNNGNNVTTVRFRMKNRKIRILP